MVELGIFTKLIIIQRMTLSTLRNFAKVERGNVKEGKRKMPF